MSNIQVKFYFDTQTESIARDEIEEFLVDTTDATMGDVEALNDHELLALLNENGIDEFFDNGSWTFPSCIRCDIEEEE